MRQTLFYISPWLFEGPLLIAWLVAGAIYLAFLYRRHGNDGETWSFLPVYGITAAVIYFLLPNLGVTGVDPANPLGPEIPLGLAVRGYGLFLLLGISAGVGVTLLRCRHAGMVPDQVINLGFWMMIAGIAGARIFYVVQKPEEFFGPGNSGSFAQSIGQVINMTQGGLVVYGSLIGGSIAGMIFLWLNRLPVFKVADLIAPGMVLGLAFGRIGCLMNGCCYGGACEPGLPSLQFPPGSAPFMHQLHRGELLGLETIVSEDQTRRIRQVRPQSVGEELGLEVDDEVFVATPDSRLVRHIKKFGAEGAEESSAVEIYSRNSGTIKLPISKLPDRSLPTHPTQVYSSVNALLLFLTLWFFWTTRREDGQVFALMLILYSISRFLIEIIRQDEAGQFGTEFTISQWVSIGTILAGFAIFAISLGRRANDEDSSRVARKN